MCLLANSGRGRNQLRPPQSPTVQDDAGFTKRGSSKLFQQILSCPGRTRLVTRSSFDPWNTKWVRGFPSEWLNYCIRNFRTKNADRTENRVFLRKPGSFPSVSYLLGRISADLSCPGGLVFFKFDWTFFHTRFFGCHFVAMRCLFSRQLD